jgi:hypothetical protein
MLKRSVTNQRLGVTIILFALVSCLSVYLGLGFDDEFGSYVPEPIAVPSVYNKKSSGFTGLYEILNQARIPCRIWQQSYRSLASKRGTLVIVEPSRSLTPGECKCILDWVSAGNELIYLDYFSFQPLSIPLFERAGLRYKSVTKIDNMRLPAKSSRPEYAHVKTLVVSSNARIAGGNTVVSDKDGDIFSEVNYGNGRLRLGLVSGFCANKQLTHKIYWDNFQFMHNLLATAPGTIYFDERCHGYSRSSNLFVFLMFNTPGLVVSQLAAILAIAVASGAQRFGQIKERKAVVRLSGVQFIEGLANTYARAKAAPIALDIIQQDFKARICKSLTLPINTDTTGLIKALLEVSPGISRNLATFLADYEREKKERNLSESSVKQLIDRADQISQEINDAIGKNGTIIGTKTDV